MFDLTNVLLSVNEKSFAQHATQMSEVDSLTQIPYFAQVQSGGLGICFFSLPQEIAKTLRYGDRRFSCIF